MVASAARVDEDVGRLYVARLSRGVLRDQVRVLDLGRDRGLALEARSELRIVGELGGDDLEGDDPIRVLLACAVDDPDASASRGGLDGELAHVGARPHAGTLSESGGSISKRRPRKTPAVRAMGWTIVSGVYVSMFRSCVSPDRAPESVAAFRNRGRLVEDAAGFLGLEVWQGGRDVLHTFTVVAR